MIDEPNNIERVREALHAVDNGNRISKAISSGDSDLMFYVTRLALGGFVNIGITDGSYTYSLTNNGHRTLRSINEMIELSEKHGTKNAWK